MPFSVSLGPCLEGDGFGWILDLPSAQKGLDGLFQLVFSQHAGRRNAQFEGKVLQLGSVPVAIVELG